MLESIEGAVIKDPVAADGACVFTGRTVICVGDHQAHDDDAGHLLERDLAVPVCDKTAANLAALHDPEILVTAPT